MSGGRHDNQPLLDTTFEGRLLSRGRRFHTEADLYPDDQMGPYLRDFEVYTKYRLVLGSVYPGLQQVPVVGSAQLGIVLFNVLLDS